MKGKPVQFESSLEHDFLELLDFDHNVLKVTAQPVRIPYRDKSGRKRSYIPDFLGITAAPFRGRSKGFLCEVKYREDLVSSWPSLKPKFLAARSYAREHGFLFVIMTEVEIRNTFLENAKLLNQYREMGYDAGVEEQLASTLAIMGETTPKALIEAAFRTEEKRQDCVATLLRMIAMFRVHTILTEKITMNSTIWITTGEGFQCDPHSYHPHLV